MNVAKLIFFTMVTAGLPCSYSRATASVAPTHENARVVASWHGDVTIEPSLRMHAEGIPWDYELQIALPPSYFKKKQNYPVLWVTDGSYQFDTAVTVVNLVESKHLPEMIIVAVGVPPNASKEWRKRRLYDFTPENLGYQFEGYGSELANRELKETDDRYLAAGMQIATKFGGAPAFLKFLIETARPALARKYRMANDNTLFGHSGGGTFCVYALLARPDGFSRYICGSPALAWGNYGLFKMEQEYSRMHKDLPAEVFFGAGDEEITDKDQAYATVSSMTRMAEILTARHYPSLKLYAHIFPGEDHESVMALNLGWGLRTLWESEVNRPFQ